MNRILWNKGLQKDEQKTTTAQAFLLSLVTSFCCGLWPYRLLLRNKEYSLRVRRHKLRYSASQKQFFLECVVFRTSMIVSTPYSVLNQRSVRLATSGASDLDTTLVRISVIIRVNNHSAMLRNYSPRS